MIPPTQKRHMKISLRGNVATREVSSRYLTSMYGRYCLEAEVLPQIDFSIGWCVFSLVCYDISHHYQEDGVAPAIHAQHLSSFILTLHRGGGGEITSDNMVESYTVSFDYHHGETCSGMQVADANSQLLISAKTRLYELVQEVSTTILSKEKTTAPLPGKIKSQTGAGDS